MVNKARFKWIIATLILCLSAVSWADDKQLLQARLDKIQGFYAQFSQKVTNDDGGLIQDGAGEIWVNRPHFFNWTMNEPDETVIISNGQTVWFYTPLVEQVTVMDFSQVVDNNLLLLITNSYSDTWNDYQVQRQQNNFILTPIQPMQQRYTITVLPTGMIANFAIIDTDGQRSYYELSHQTLGNVDTQKFEFVIPAGLTIDDQRVKSN